MLQQVELGALPAKEWLKVANQALKLTTESRARNIGAKHHLNVADILPLPAIANSRDEKFPKFHEQQLQQGHKKSQGISV